MGFGKRATFYAAAFAMSLGLQADTVQGGRFTNSEAAVANEAFDTVKQYWVTQRVGIAATNLVLLGEHDDITCGNSLLRGQHRIALYCHGTNDVVISEAFVDELRQNEQISFTTAVRLVIAHELGHAVQDVNGLLKDEPGSGKFLLIETTADCLAGTAMRETYPENTGEAARFVGSFAFDFVHGIGSARAHYFNMGVSGEDCLEQFSPWQ